MMWGYPGYGFDGGGGWIGMVAMMLFGLLFLVGIVLLIVWLVRNSAGGGAGPMHRSGTQEACDIAKLRYARGEITKEQFDEICRGVGG